jgi:hypothetical protein
MVLKKEKYCSACDPAREREVKWNDWNAPKEKDNGMPAPSKKGKRSEVKWMLSYLGNICCVKIVCWFLFGWAFAN